jgi:hypothetical protein
VRLLLTGDIGFWTAMYENIKMKQRHHSGAGSYGNGPSADYRPVERRGDERH